jgi:hypothetical protein
MARSFEKSQSLPFYHVWDLDSGFPQRDGTGNAYLWVKTTPIGINILMEKPIPFRQEPIKNDGKMMFV